MWALRLIQTTRRLRLRGRLTLVQGICRLVCAHDDVGFCHDVPGTLEVPGTLRVLRDEGEQIVE